ncbi:MAG TPA: carboxypeptidase-like regulatory domain-containing protein [Candidatus Thermoplasmatota archaeon]|nr:carboxypeptidase-like regulatory domain-containing protein [Candidatus Thermoplasmatota archaeon]
MRPLLAAAVLVLLPLAGCAGDPGGDGVADDGSDFDDLGLDATATTGVLLGVVVDETIRPIPEASVALRGAARGDRTATTDEDGRFAFGDLEPGTYFLEVSALQFAPAQSSAEVVAGVDEPPVLRIQLERLFDQEPFVEQLKFDGFLACAYAIGVSSTCVNDYTRILTVCPGGCLRDYNLSETGGNVREYVTPVGPGWQDLVFEMVWEPTASGTSEQLGIVVSYYGRIGASHTFDSDSQPSPLRLEIKVDPDASTPPGEVPDKIPAAGIPDLFVFFSAGSGSVAVNQPFQAFQTSFYYGVPPDGWSFVNGDPLPF